jgi:HPt (histidine-containing phosphotransfer) domain-containing protein
MSDEKIIITVDSDLEDLIPGFLENRTTDCEKLRAAHADGDLTSIQSIGHNLKGLGGGYGFEKMSELGASIESAAKSGDTGVIPGLINELADYLQHIDVKFE